MTNQNYRKKPYKFAGANHKFKIFVQGLLITWVDRGQVEARINLIWDFSINFCSLCVQ